MINSSANSRLLPRIFSPIPAITPLGSLQDKLVASSWRESIISQSSKTDVKAFEFSDRALFLDLDSNTALRLAVHILR